jgi:hypothetical protein
MESVTQAPASAAISNAPQPTGPIERTVVRLTARSACMSVHLAVVGGGVMLTGAAPLRIGQELRVPRVPC